MTPSLPPLLKQPKLHELSWLGGIIDGEGTICLTKHNDKYDPRLQIANTSQLILDKTKAIFNNNGIYQVHLRPKNGVSKLGHKDCGELSIHVYSEILLALKLIQDYLVGKEEQCRLLREYLGLRLDKMDPRRAPYTPREIEIYELLRVLNKRGV